MSETQEATPDATDLPTGGWLIALRLFFPVLTLLTVAALFGDVITWAVKGTQYALSPGFAKVGTKMAGFTEIVLVGAYGGFVKDKIEKPWEGKGLKMELPVALLSLIVFLLAGLPLAAFVLVFVHHLRGSHLYAARFGPALAAHPVGILWLLLVVAILALVFACKGYVVSQVWNFTVPLFKRQPERRFVIESE